MSVIKESLANGKMAQKLPRGTNTLALIHLLLDEGGKYVSVRTLEKVLGYSTSTFRRAFEGRSQDDTLLYLKYLPETKRYKLDPLVTMKTREFIEEVAPMKSHPPVRIINGSLKGTFQKYSTWAKKVN